MLPVHRVIGHKEYGNVGHPGRKTDPTYDMNWRRSRVAAFQPRTGPVGPTPEEDDDMPKHLRAPNGTIFLFTGDEIVTTNDPAQVERWTGLFGPWKNITQAQWDDLVALTERNRPDGKAPKEFFQDLARRIEAFTASGGAPAVNLDTSGVAADLAANPAFVDAFAEATAQKLAARLQA